jgi:pyrimidine deaminase RibD-like protein
MQQKTTIINTNYIKAALKLATEYACTHVDQHPGHAHIGAVIVSAAGTMTASANNTENHAELNAYHTAKDPQYYEKRYYIDNCESQT